MVSTVCACVVLSGGAPTPAGTSVFTKHNWNMGMGYLWLNGWGIYHLMGGAFMAYWVGYLYHLMDGTFGKRFRKFSANECGYRQVTRGCFAEK